MKLINLLIAIQFTILLPKSSCQVQVSCGSSSGIDYYCEQGLTCCQQSECCTSLQFCTGIAGGTCIGYIFITVLPATTCIMIIICFFNYKNKRNFLNDVESYYKLSRECYQQILDENEKQLTDQQEQSEENKQSQEDSFQNYKNLINGNDVVSFDEKSESKDDQGGVKDDEYEQTQLKNRNLCVNKDDKCFEDERDQTVDFLFNYKKFS